MNTLIHADIFFFVTTIIAALIGICLVVILVIGIQIMRNLKAFSETLKREGELVAEDVASLRGEFRREGFRLAGLLRFFTQLFKKGGRQRSSASSKKHETHDA